jgi:hypothetical protein
VLKQTTSLLKVLLVGDLFEGPTMTYGGDEEIVLKEELKKALKPEKTVK